MNVKNGFDAYDRGDVADDGLHVYRGNGLRVRTQTDDVFFSRLNGTEISALLRKGRIWGRAYRMDIARTDRYIRSVARIGGDVSADPDADHAMDALAEYHLGTPGMPHGKTAR